MPTRLLYTALLLLFSSTLSATKAKYEDWLSNCHSSCQGKFVQFDRYLKALEQGTDQFNIVADNGTLRLDGQSVLNKVRIQQNQSLIFANRAKLIAQANTKKIASIELSGEVKFVQANLAIDAEYIKLIPDNATSSIKDIQYRLYDKNAHGSAKQGNYSNKQLQLHQADYSTCSPWNLTWQLKARELLIDQDKQFATARHCVLYLKNHPILYSPYLGFNLDERRKTGFLPPEYAKTSVTGQSISLPFYINLAKNYDTTFAIKINKNRAPQLKQKIRYLGQNNEGIIKFNGILQDKKNPIVNDRNNARFYLKAHNKTTIGDNWSAEYDISYASDQTYYRDFIDPIYTNPNAFLTQNAKIAYDSANGHTSFGIRQFQTTQVMTKYYYIHTYHSRPYLSSSYYAKLNNYLSFQNLLDYNYFVPNKSEKLILNEPSHRLVLRPKLALDFANTYYQFKPSLAWHLVYYQSKTKQPAVYQLPIFKLKGNLRFMRQFNYQNQAVNHSIKPQLVYLQVPNRAHPQELLFDTQMLSKDNEAWSSNRFNGLDQIGDTKQIKLQIFNDFRSLTMPNHSFHWQLDQIFYLKDRQQILRPAQAQQSFINNQYKTNKRKISPFYQAFRYKTNKTQIYGNLAWDFSRDQQQVWSLGFRQELSNNSKIDLAYHQFKIDDLNPRPAPSLDLSRQFVSRGFVEINPQWRLLLQHKYSFDLHQSTDKFIGLEHRGCCVAMRFVFGKVKRQNMKARNKFELEFTLNGLAELGTGSRAKITRAIKSKIPQYAPL